MVNFKKVQEIIPGRKNKQGQSKTQTKVKVDILLHVIPSENENGDSIPKPCTDNQVSLSYNLSMPIYKGTNLNPACYRIFSVFRNSASLHHLNMFTNDFTKVLDFLEYLSRDLKGV